MRTSRWTLFVSFITVIALAMFGFFFVRAFYTMPDLEIAVPGLEAQAPAAGLSSDELPSRLVIPQLKIDADVQQVGIAASGNMAVPSKYSDVGWYKYGPAPGQPGSAVIAGHVDNGLALAGVFKRLGELRLGDEVIVKTRGGAELRFIVVDIRRYDYNAVPTGKLFEPGDFIHLNLITCSGDWVSSEKTYDERLVIYTALAQR